MVFSGEKEMKGFITGRSNRVICTGNCNAPESALLLNIKRNSTRKFNA